ncbi:MAG: hypothetical protein V3V10_02690 [Planctomycetota bacterium]
MVIASPLPILSHRKAEISLVPGPQSHATHLTALAELSLTHWAVVQHLDAGEIKALEFTPIDPAVTGFKAIVAAGHAGANTASPDNPNTNWLHGGCSINVSGGYVDYTDPNPFADGEFSGYWLSLPQDNSSYSIDKMFAIESPETLWLFAERNDGQVFPLYAFGELWDANSDDPQDSADGTSRLFGMMSCTPNSTNIEAGNQWLSHQNSANRAHAGCFTANGFENIEHHGRRNNSGNVGGNIRRSGKTLLMPHFYDYTNNGQHFAGVLREVGYTRHCQAHQAMTDGQIPPNIQMILMSNSSISDAAGYGFHIEVPTIVTT